MRYYRRINWEKHKGHVIYVVAWKGSIIDGWESFNGEGELVEDSRFDDPKWAPASSSFVPCTYEEFKGIIEECQRTTNN